MYNFLYSRPLWLIVIIMAAAILLWAYLAWRRPRHWRMANGILLPIALFAVLFITLLRRTAGDTGLCLIPFHAFAAAKAQPEVWRMLLMNVFLFVPVGLTLPWVLPEKWRPGRRCLTAVMAGLILSIGIEWLQYRCALGTAETDDVLCNTLGALLGVCHLLLADRITKHRS